MREWLAATENALGAIVGPQVLYDLGKAWYAGRLDDDYEPLSGEAKAALFERLGLVGDFWTLGT